LVLGSEIVSIPGVAIRHLSSSCENNSQALNGERNGRFYQKNAIIRRP
jgi:hypothetical protein